MKLGAVQAKIRNNFRFKCRRFFLGVINLQNISNILSKKYNCNKIFLLSFLNILVTCTRISLVLVWAYLMIWLTDFFWKEIPILNRNYFVKVKIFLWGIQFGTPVKSSWTNLAMYRVNAILIHSNKLSLPIERQNKYIDTIIYFMIF